MKKNLESRTVKLEEKIPPKKPLSCKRFFGDEWDKLTEQEQAEMNDKHDIIIVRKIVSARGRT